VGEWLAPERLAEIEPFGTGKRPFKVRLATNFGLSGQEAEPGIKAAVRREYAAGEIICRAGEYGSTAFLILEGRATELVPEESRPVPARGRTAGSLGRLRRAVLRHTAKRAEGQVDALALGEISPYGTADWSRPPAPRSLGPGDFFGIDTCVNFHPREATVRAEERSVVVEMLRSVLDSIREATDAGKLLDEGYRTAAVRAELRRSPLLRVLGDDALDELANEAVLLTADSDEVRDGAIYAEGDPADAAYLVRSGTIKVGQLRSGREFVFSYLGRGGAFGLEGLLPSEGRTTFTLTCVSHPEEIGPVELHGSLTVGRSASCDLVIPDPTRAISRRHCRIEERDGEFYLTDLDSDNGTQLNGEPIREALLVAGDRIEVVDRVFEVGRARPDETSGLPITRVASATGLDNFEVVRIPVDALRRLRDREPVFASALRKLVRRGGSVAPGGPIACAPSPEAVEIGLYNAQNVLLIDLDRCTRCDECVRACADAHGGVARFVRDGPRLGKYLVAAA
jgi:CRP-like cAMP-binding protein